MMKDMEVRELTKIENELMDRLIEIWDKKEFVCCVVQDCYDDVGRQQMIDYLDESGCRNTDHIIMVGMEIGDKREQETK